MSSVFFKPLAVCERECLGPKNQTLLSSIFLNQLKNKAQVEDTHQNISSTGKAA